MPRWSRRTVLLAGLTAVASPASAQLAFRVKDINTGTRSSNPSGFARFGSSQLFYQAQNAEGALVEGLFRTDGTSAGTVLVKAIDVGLFNRAVGVDLGGRLLFAGDGGSGQGMELWRSDGTGPGTVLQSDIEPGPGSSNPRSLTVAGSRAFFVATTGPLGSELWAIDDAGAFLVKDIVPGPGSSDPMSLTAVGSQVFFSAFTAGEGRELWRSDGTAAGTVRVADLHPGPTGSSPNSLVALAGTVLFAAASPGAPNQGLWRSDGTESGTRRLAAVEDPRNLARVGTSVYFSGFDAAHGQELWRTDGTPEGTALLADLLPGPNSTLPSFFTDVAGTVFFTATLPASGTELWKSDGTTSGTALVKDIRPGPLGSDTFSQLTAAGDRLFFAANDGTGAELWRSDGTEAGTVVVAAINPGSSANPAFLTELGGAVLFRALDGLHGYELWRTDGTPGGTSLVVDLALRVGDSEPRGFIDLGGRLVFSADDGVHGREMWVSDGTVAGTRLLRDVNPGAGDSVVVFNFSRTRQMAVYGGRVVFSAYDNTSGFELWTTDGDAATVLAKDIYPGVGSSLPQEFLAGEAGVLFSASSFAGLEPWRTDGTGAGTYQVHDINPGGDSFPHDWARLGPRTLFVANDGVRGAELWVTDDAINSTALVRDIWPGPPASEPQKLTAAGGLVFFLAADGVHGTELWRSDGTASGTLLVKDIVPGSQGPQYGELAAAGGRLFFVVCQGAPAACGLWKSNGTESGTVLLHDYGPFAPTKLTAVGADLYFAGNDGVRGEELWRSDGTAAGTSLFADLMPGPPPGYPSQLTPLGGGLAFSALTPAAYAPMWTDGTAEGTLLIDEVAPWPVVDQTQFVPSGPLVYYAARVPFGDDELWAIPRSAFSDLRVSDCSVAEGDSGTRTCVFTAALSGPLTTPVTADFSTVPGTATAGIDYQTTSGSLVFPPGTTSQTIPVAINGDTVAEGNEGFSLVLTNVVGTYAVDATGTGAILDDEPTRFHTLAPCRLVDTRSPAGPFGGPPLGANRTRTFPLTDRCGLPASAKALAAILTAVNAEEPGNLRAYPAGAAAPLTSVINFVPGRTRANNAIVGLGANGSIAVQCDMAPGSTAVMNLVLDVFGYFE